MFRNVRSPFVATSIKSRRRSRRSGLFGSFSKSAGGGTPLRSSRTKKPKSNIKVCVRVRPRNEVERSNIDSRNVVRVLDETILVFDPHQQQTPSYFKGKAIRDPTIRKNKDLKFAYDCIFDIDATNQNVYEGTTQNVIDKLLEGINCSVFAYGATGSGKTYTMVGTTEQPGVISRTVLELYEKIESMVDDVSCDVEVSYLEIYNEMVRDLFRPENEHLNVRDDGVQGIAISNLSYHRPVSADELMSMLENGNGNRTQHPTDANAESSRSHAVFQIILSQRPRTADISSDVLVSKMSLIDLAGSERATATKNSGERFREGANINRSLLSLGNCINALAQGKRGAHIPYRDSKLTRILKDSLGGNCQTVMIANLSPSSLSYDDSYKTLQYADRAKHIKAELMKNVYRVDYHVHEYSKIVQDLHSEISELKCKLHSCEEENKRQKHRIESLEFQAKTAQSDPVASKLIESAIPMVSHYTTIQTEYLHNELQHKMQQHRLDVRNLIQKRLEHVQSDLVKLSKDTDKTGRIKAQCVARLEHFQAKMDSLMESLNNAKKNALMCSSSILSGPPKTSLVQAVLESCGQKSDIVNLSCENQYLKEMVREKEAMIEHDSRMLENLMLLAREQHFIISGMGRMTEKLTEDLDSVLKLVRCPKEVAFSNDQQSISSLSLSNLCLDLKSEISVEATASISDVSTSCNKSVRKSLFSEPDDATFVLHRSEPTAIEKENVPPKESVRLRSPPPQTCSSSLSPMLTDVSNQPTPPCRIPSPINQATVTLRRRSPMEEPKTKNSADTNFKRPCGPPPQRKMSETTRKCIRNVKRLGLPSAVETAMNDKKKLPTGRKLMKSPSTSRLNLGPENNPCAMTKKVLSSTNLRRL